MTSESLVRVAVDVGGTFTDLVGEDTAGRFHIFKSSTTPEDPTQGLLDVLGVAAEARHVSVAELLAPVELFIHGTTRATNAIINDDTARTALLVTQGHPDILLWREGTRIDTFDYSQQNPRPYVDRKLTFEVPERIDALGEVVKPLDEAATVEVLSSVADLGVEAVAVCLLWSVLNGSHELRLGELIEEHLPGTPYTLSHALMPTVREYRRASAASIDASLKPLMSAYLTRVATRLADAGLRGQLLMMTSSGGVRDLDDVAAMPIHSIASGPAAAPVAGRRYAADAGAHSAIITDAGGTSYDVSVVRNGVIPFTRETVVGSSRYGHMTGFTSVEVNSIGAGGGSIASVDDGGLLHVGPRSAGAVPGPACYGRGGTEPTVTDASLVVGYLDAEYFLGGRMSLSRSLAEQAIERAVAKPLGTGVELAAAAVLELQVEHMVGAIEGITLGRGVDPRSAVLVAGGGSAGFHSVAIARRLGCAKVVVPETVAALSATGALLSDLVSDYVATHPTSTDAFDFDGVNAVLSRLRVQCEEFAERASSLAERSVITFSAEARYRDQVWELEVPLRADCFAGADDVSALRADFDRTHLEILAHQDPHSDVEVVSWHAGVRCFLRDADTQPGPTARIHEQLAPRRVFFKDGGWLETSVFVVGSLEPNTYISGPAILESPVTTIVVEPGSVATRTTAGSVIVDVAGSADKLEVASAVGAGRER